MFFHNSDNGGECVTSAWKQKLLWQFLFTKDFHSRFLLFFFSCFPRLASAQLGTMIDGRGATVKMMRWSTRHRLVERPVKGWETQKDSWAAVCVENIEEYLFLPLDPIWIQNSSSMAAQSVNLKIYRLTEGKHFLTSVTPYAENQKEKKMAFDPGWIKIADQETNFTWSLTVDLLNRCCLCPSFNASHVSHTS